MGSDDLFHKRKAKKTKDIQRKKASRKPYDRVLIVCEGEKTEPYYFEEMKRVLDIDSANIEIDGSCGSSPKSVVDYAFSLFSQEKIKGGHYDRVFCVIDRDEHHSYRYAIDRIKEISLVLIKERYSKIEVFRAVLSEPCFEYWFLLHFDPSTKPYHRAGKKSACRHLIDDLKKYSPNYEKKQQGFYAYSIENSLLEAAKKHAERIFTNSQRTGNTNPSSNVYELVEYLENIKNTV